MSDAGAFTNEVFLPDAVRRAGARADELLRGGVVSQPPPSPEDPGADRTPPAPEPPPASPVEDSPPAPQEPPPAAAAGTEWEQRYRTLQGKYDAEIPSLRGQIASLEQLLATLHSPPATGPSPPPASGGPVQYNEEDLNLYGQDLLEAATRAAEARYGPVVSKLEAQLAELTGRQNNSAQLLHQDRVFQQLDRDPELAGRWEQINVHPDFRAWLGVIDEYSGVSRFEMLQHAYQNGDAMRTGRFFKKFIAEHTGNSLPPAAHTTTAPAARQGNGHAATASPRLEDFAAPGRASGAQGGNGAREPKFWSRSEIQRFYQDRTRGRFKGREDESQRLETDIIAAAREGRIQNQ
jgi:hypothetical protein